MSLCAELAPTSLPLECLAPGNRAVYTDGLSQVDRNPGALEGPQPGNPVGLPYSLRGSWRVADGETQRGLGCEELEG